MQADRDSLPEQSNNEAPDKCRPFWSVMIPVYNRTDYLRQAIESVLAQAPGPEEMQIEVVDDHSPNLTIKDIVESAGKGRVSYFRQPENLGLFANWQDCIRRARGEVVHILHDDDFVLPGFYNRLREGFDSDPQIGAAFCRHFYVNEEEQSTVPSTLERESAGIIPQFFELICLSNRIEIAAIAVKRSAYLKLGDFESRLPFCADWDYWKRLAKNYPIWFVPETLACFRVHKQSASASLRTKAITISDELRAIEIARGYLPDAVANNVCKASREKFANRELGRLWQSALVKSDLQEAAVAARDAMRFSCSSHVLINITKTFTKYVLVSIMRKCSLNPPRKWIEPLKTD